MFVHVLLYAFIDTCRFMLFSFVFPILILEAVALVVFAPLPIFNTLGMYVTYLLLGFFLLIFAESVWKGWRGAVRNLVVTE